MAPKKQKLAPKACFAGLKIVVIAAEPMQRQIWSASIQNITFLRRDEVARLEGKSYDYVVSRLDAEAWGAAVRAAAGAAKVVGERWLTGSLRTGALEAWEPHAWGRAAAAAAPDRAGATLPLRAVAVRVDGPGWAPRVAALVAEHAAHVVLLRSAAPLRCGDLLPAPWLVVASTATSAVLSRCAASRSGVDQHAGLCAWRCRAGDVFAVADVGAADLGLWASRQRSDGDMVAVLAGRGGGEGLGARFRDAYRLLRPGAAPPAAGACDSLRYGAGVAGDAAAAWADDAVWVSTYGGATHRLDDCCVARAGGGYAHVLSLLPRRRELLGDGVDDDVPAASRCVVYRGGCPDTLTAEAALRVFPSAARGGANARILDALRKVGALEAARDGGDRGRAGVNPRVLYFERAYAMCLSWPKAFRKHECVEEFVRASPFLSEDGRAIKIMEEALEAPMSWDACAAWSLEKGLADAVANDRDAFTTATCPDELIATHRMAKVFGISIGAGVDDAARATGAKFRGAVEVVQALRRRGVARPEPADAAAAAAADPAFAARLSGGARAGLARHDDFFGAPLEEPEFADVVAAVKFALEAQAAHWRARLGADAVDGRAWVVERVGGARRRLGGEAGHDCDLLITHPAICSYARIREVLDRLKRTLAARGRLEGSREGGLEGDRFGDGTRGLPRAAALEEHVGSVLSDNAPEDLARVPVFRQIRDEIAGRGSGWQHWDHLARHFGVFRGTSGRWRRVDLIVAAHLEWPFALLSWTGGKVYNRLLRLHANKMDASLSAHCLMTVPKDGSDAKLIPLETHPGTPWPRTEEDVLRLLGVPWLPPHLRDV